MLEKKTVLVQWYVFLHIIIEHQYKHRRLFKRFQCGILPYFFPVPICCWYHLETKCGQNSCGQKSGQE